jgi:hypothetical protein
VDSGQVAGEVHQAGSNPMFPQIHNQGGERYAKECASDDIAQEMEISRE